MSERWMAGELLDAEYERARIESARRRDRATALYTMFAWNLAILERLRGR